MRNAPGARRLAGTASAPRKALLTLHVSASVGWLGAVAAFLALAVTGASSTDAKTAAAACIAMGITTWYAIVPFCLASFISGLICSLASPWGLFRHYWVLVKLSLTIPSTLLLLLHTRSIAYLGEAARSGAALHGPLRSVQIELIAQAGAAALVLLIATTLSTYKPRGTTPIAFRAVTDHHGS